MKMNVTVNAVSITGGEVTSSSAAHTDFGSTDITSGSVDRIFPVTSTTNALIYSHKTENLKVNPLSIFIQDGLTKWIFIDSMSKAKLQVKREKMRIEMRFCEADSKTPCNFHCE